MDTLKKPEIIVTTVNTAILLGAIIYFYRQNSSTQSELNLIKDKVAKATVRIADMGVYGDHINQLANAVNTITKNMKRNEEYLGADINDLMNIIQLQTTQIEELQAYIKQQDAEFKLTENTRYSNVQRLSPDDDRDSRDYRDVRDPRDSRDLRDSRDSRDSRDLRDYRRDGTRDMRSRDGRETRALRPEPGRDFRDARSMRDSRLAPRDAEPYRYERDTRDTRDSRRVQFDDSYRGGSRQSQDLINFPQGASDDDAGLDADATLAAVEQARKRGTSLNLDI